MIKEIVVAGGCFWGVEEYYRRVNGVIETKVGYAQGMKAHPSYQEVCTGATNHVEVCYIIYDDNILTLEKLLNLLFRIIDPTSLNRQGGDIGTQYRTGIYYVDADDKEIIDEFLSKEQALYPHKIVVECEQLKKFYTAEEYHQKYLVKNSNGYCHVDFHKLEQEDLKEEYRKPN